MFDSLVSYLKNLLGLLPKEREYFYFNPEGDFQDIRGISPIEDYSIITFFIFIILFICFIMWALYRLKKYAQYKKSIQINTIAKRHLSSFNIHDAKECAYAFSLWAPYLINEKNKDIFKKIEEDFFKYKYKKHTQELKYEEQNNLKLFLDKYNG